MRKKQQRYKYVVVRRVQDCIDGDIVDKLYKDCTVKQAIAAFNKRRLNWEWDSVPFRDTYCIYADDIDPVEGCFDPSVVKRDGWSIPEFTKNNY